MKLLRLVEADEPDGDWLVFSAVGLPAELAPDPESGEISGTIADGAAAGSLYVVEVIVTDPVGATATSGLQWTVAAPDSLPVVVDLDIWPFCISSGGHGVIPVVIYTNADVAAHAIDVAGSNAVGATEATLTASLDDGTPLVGTDEIGVRR